MHTDFTFRTLAIMLLSGLLLTACGGGSGGSGDGSTQTTTKVTIDGFYAGQTSSGESVTGVILPDNSYFLLYSAVNDPASFAGAIFGQGTSQNGSFSSAGAHDIKLDGSAQNITLSASLDSKKTFNGTLAYPNNTSATFTTSYHAGGDSAPTLAALAGVYTGTIAIPGDAEPLTLTVASDGTMSAPLLCECNLSAIAQPSGTSNTYRVMIEFAGGTHILSGQHVDGTAYLDVDGKHLYLIGLTNSSQQPVIYVGTRP